MTLAKRFIEKASELVPDQDELQKLDPSLDDASVIDEFFFRKSEYLGGMATAILSVLSREDRDAPTGTFASKSQFEDALRRILGETEYENYVKSGFTPGDFCGEVAQRAFLGDIEKKNTTQGDLNLIRCVAQRLWKGDGTTGLSS